MLFAPLQPPREIPIEPLAEKVEQFELVHARHVKVRKVHKHETVLLIRFGSMLSSMGLYNVHYCGITYLFI
jgi:hypothetical protein